MCQKHELRRVGVDERGGSSTDPSDEDQTKLCTTGMPPFPSAQELSHLFCDLGERLRLQLVRKKCETSLRAQGRFKRGKSRGKKTIIGQ